VVREGGVQVLQGEAATRRWRGRHGVLSSAPLPRLLLPLQEDHRPQPRHLHVQVRSHFVLYSNQHQLVMLICAPVHVIAQRRLGVLQRGLQGGPGGHGRGAPGGGATPPPPAHAAAAVLAAEGGGAGDAPPADHRQPRGAQSSCHRQLVNHLISRPSVVQDDRSDRLQSAAQQTHDARHVVLLIFHDLLFF
jgi:hypothetical protein